MKKIALFTAVLTLVMFLLASCGNSIVGTWSKTDSSILGDLTTTYTFNSDGTGNINALGMNVSFTYTTEKDQITITYGASAGSLSFSSDETFTYSVSGDSLTLTSGNTATIYTKSK